MTNIVLVPHQMVLRVDSNPFMIVFIQYMVSVLLASSNGSLLLVLTFAANSFAARAGLIHCLQTKVFA